MIIKHIFFYLCNLIKIILCKTFGKKEKVMSKNKKYYHVVYSKKNVCWEVKQSLNKQALVAEKTKKLAVAAARAISKENKGELVIHNKNGKISSRDSHGNDPVSSKG